MARQSGIIKLEGTIGDVTFFKTKRDTYSARKKASIKIKENSNGQF